MVKIGRLRLKNFKSFENTHDFDFTNRDLIIFDGPNGYGKTTIFDSIELALVKKISRYLDVDTKVKKTSLFKSTNDESLIVLELLEENITKTVILVEINDGKFNRISDTYSNLEYSYYNNWEDALNKENKNDNIPEILFDNHISNLFDIFNYVQQEDTVNFLKYDEKKRHEKLSHLLGTTEKNVNYDKIENLYKILKNKRDSLDEDVLFLGAEINKISGIDFKIKNFENEILIIGPLDGAGKEEINEKIRLLNKLKNIIGNSAKYKKSKIKSENDYILLKNIELEEVFKYHTFDLDSFRKGRNKYNSILEKTIWLESLTVFKKFTADRDKLLENIKNTNIVFIKNIYSKNKDLIKKYNKSKSESNSFTVALDDFMNKRKEFIESIDHKSHNFISDNSCPVCGKNYQSLDDLNVKINNLEDFLASFKNDRNSEYYLYSEEIQNNIVNKVIERIDYFTNKYKFLFDVLRKLEFYDFSLDKISLIRDFVYNLNELGFDFNANSNKLENYYSFINDIDCYDLNELIDFEKVMEDLNVTFTGDEFLFDDSILNNDIVDGNIDYTHRLLYEANKTDLFNKNDELINKKTQIKNLTSKIESIYRLKTAYEESIEEYERLLVSNIQIPFFIYSSKIFQSRKHGSGLFLKISEKRNNNNFIKFIANRADDNDAWNRLSSGQLSGLVIALTLSMNKAFLNSLKFLLIDDPIHYMDDINMASLTQLLMYEFNDHQFIFSTHDHKVSSYFTRKYQDFQLKSATINLKDMKFKNDILL